MRYKIWSIKSKKSIFMAFFMIINIFPVEVYGKEFTDNYLKFKNISIEDGLTQSSIRCTYQDSLGYIWIGTYEGLNRYNGYEFKQYKYDSKNEASISSNYISDIVEDNEMNLWVATSNGLNKYDRKLDTFKTYNTLNSSISHYIINEIEIDQNGVLWVATDDGINRYYKETDSFENIYKNTIDRNSEVYDIAFDSSGLMWIGSSRGLQAYDLNKNSFITLDENIIKILDEKYISDLFYDRWKNKIWIGTEGNGLYILDLYTSSIDKFESSNTTVNNVRDIIRCEKGFIWIATSKGLIRYDEYQDTSTIYKYKVYDRDSLISDDILSLYEDKNGLIWVGTIEGMSRFNSQDKFTNYTYNPEYENSLSGKMVFGIYEDDDGYLWVSTRSEGINIINTQTGDVSIIDGEELGILDTNLWSITGKENNIYVATSSGIVHIDKENNSYNLITKENNPGINNNEIRKLYIDNENTLWIGTRNGLSRLYENGEIKSYTEEFKSKGATELFITSIHQDTEDSDIMWFGSAIDGGLMRYNTKNGKLKIYKKDDENLDKSISINSIKSIDEDLHGNLWIGTNYGLSKLDKYTDQFTNYTEQDGLSHNLVYGALVDSSGDIWCSTNRGISKFETKNKKFVNFTSESGLPSDEFNSYAFFKNNNDDFYFGSINGLTIFNARDFSKDNTSSNIVIDSISIRGSRTILDTSFIVLGHKENTFDIDFFLNDFRSNSNNIKYEYMLKGFDGDWIDNGSRNYISYTNIPPGNYDLLIRGRDAFGKLSDPTKVSIIITNPPWRTPVAYWAYVVIIGILIYIWINKVNILEQIVRQRTDELNAKLIENKELYDKVIQHERYKNNYFVNLSHELRTPLNVILSTEQLITRLNSSIGNIPKEKLSEYMEWLRGNSNRLLNLINNIIDTSRIESGAFKINIKDEDIVYIVEEVTLSLMSLAEKKNINLIIDPDIEEKIIKCDKYNIERCITNLVGNALKFTPEGGEIIVKVYDMIDSVKISVKDNGIGIDKKYHNAIFDRFGQVFNQVSEEYGGSGLGLTLTSQIVSLHNGTIYVESEVNEGAEFIIVLPV